MTDSLLATVSSAFVHFSTDMIAVVFLWAGVLFLALLLGRGRSIAWVLGLVTMGGVYIAAQDVSFISGLFESGFMVRAAIFLGLLWVIAAIFGRVVHGEYSHKRIRKAIQLTTLSGVFTGTSIAYAFHFFGLADLYTPSILAKTLFISPEALFLWLLAGCLSVFVASRR